MYHTSTSTMNKPVTETDNDFSCEEVSDETETPFGRDSVRDMSKQEFKALLAKIDQAAEDLKTKGYAVIPSLFSKNECEEYKSRVWSFVEGLGLKRTSNFGKTTASELLPHSHGIIHSYRWNHGKHSLSHKRPSNLFLAKPFRDLRKNPKVLAVHSRLNGSSCLVSSLDRVNFKFPGRKYTSRDSWAHVDQNPRNLGLRYIQSYVTFMEGTEDSPQNRFYEGSHLKFEEFFKNKRNSTKTGEAWCRLTPGDREDIVNVHGCPLVKPTCPPGSMLLWDSRTIHDPDEGTEFQDGRLVVYLCYSRYCPEMESKPGFLKKKQEAFKTCRATPHAPFPQTLFGKAPRTYGGGGGEEPTSFSEIPITSLGYSSAADASTPDSWEDYLFCFQKYPRKIKNSVTLYANPLEKDWFGKHEVVSKDGTPLLEYTPFSVGLVSCSKKEEEDSDNKGDVKKRKRVSKEEEEVGKSKKRKTVVISEYFSKSVK